MKTFEVGQTIKPVYGMHCTHAKLEHDARRIIVSVDDNYLTTEVVVRGYSDSQSDIIAPPRNNNQNPQDQLSPVGGRS